MVGGQHGIEDSGWLAAEEIVEGYTPSQGTLVIIPRMDPVAIGRSTYGNSEWNMNREWPPGQLPRYAPVRRRWETITEVDPDVIVDLHSSGGVYGGSPSGVGQAIFPTSGSESIVDRVCNRLTKNVLGSKWDRSMAYRRGNTISGTKRLLIHKVESDLDARGFICEPTRANGTTLSERTLWNRKSAEFLLEECVGMELRQK